MKGFRLAVKLEENDFDEAYERVYLKEKLVI